MSWNEMQRAHPSHRFTLLQACISLLYHSAYVLWINIFNKSCNYLVNSTQLYCFVFCFQYWKQEFGKCKCLKLISIFLNFAYACFCFFVFSKMSTLKKSSKLEEPLTFVSWEKEPRAHMCSKVSPHFGVLCCAWRWNLLFTQKIK